MIFSISPVVSLLLLLAAPVWGQDIVYDSIHNATVITGTWSSGSKAVVTGPGFANPANQSFTYPPTAGVSYSFSADGYYEIARYRFNGNGSLPNCIVGVMNWVHGTFTLEPNGSIVMVPFGDGYQQIQDPCGAVSNFIEFYNDTELYVQWRIFQDPVDGYKLHLFQFDGSPVAPQFQVAAQPIMLPTQLLRNVSAQVTATTGQGLTTQNALAVSASGRRWDVVGVRTVLTGLFGLGLVSLLL
ncbi:hypothetical protein JAAARDRAFT_200425 [Jaapia argillacea MUCL 33604]|uniref:Protein ROT1 n=1 Tax=Jaapia argillacea MUCL 33604 TaxID=933084 RepID=A0A067P7X4_9AGAM|nr:hypothetical protein JAAARDRAFT_200425 [Jaapia argillacea MUCL 33604]